MVWVTADVDLTDVLAEATDDQIRSEYKDRFGEDPTWDDIRDLMRMGDMERVLGYLKFELYKRKGVIF